MGEFIRYKCQRECRDGLLALPRADTSYLATPLVANRVDIGGTSGHNRGEGFEVGAEHARAAV